MKKTLIIGSNGMLGQSLCDNYKGNQENLICCSKEEYNYNSKYKYNILDISNLQELELYLENERFDLIINAAAYTGVDLAETERDVCKKINIDAVKIIATVAEKYKTHFINISSDYIFDGYNGPYSETDTPNPLGYYGWSKLEGERVIRESGCKYSIIRTNVLYGITKFGRADFVKWVINSLKNGDIIKIVNDQINNPTFIDDLAKAIYKIAEKELTGIYNIGGKEFFSRFEFTLRIADYFNLNKDLVIPITTEELKQPAPRPLKSGLKIDKAFSEFNYQPLPVEKTFELIQNSLITM